MASLPEVADAIAEHYSPQGPSDRCPTAPVSIAVALADKLDTLVGFFTHNEKPTGSKDPYALRRAALGCIRLIIENELRLNLVEFFEHSFNIYIEKFGVRFYPLEWLLPEQGPYPPKRRVLFAICSPSSPIA